MGIATDHDGHVWRNSLCNYLSATLLQITLKGAVKIAWHPVGKSQPNGISNHDDTIDHQHGDKQPRIMLNKERRGEQQKTKIKRCNPEGKNLRFKYESATMV